MNSGHGGTTLRSEIGGGAQNIYTRNLAMLNQFWGTNLLNIAIRIHGGWCRQRHRARADLRLQRARHHAGERSHR